MVYENHPYITIHSPKYLETRANDFIRNVVSDLPNPIPAAEVKSRKDKDNRKKKKQQDKPEEDLFSSLF